MGNKDIIKSNGLIVLGGLAWLVGLVVALFAASLTVMASYTFGLTTSLVSANLEHNALAFAGLDAIKCVLPVAVVLAWRKGHRVTSCGLALGLVILLGASLFAATMNATTGSTRREAAGEAAAQRLADLRATLARYTRELEGLGTPKPQDQAKAAVDRHAASPKWKEAKGCTVGGVPPGSFNYCQTYNVLLGELAASSRAEELHRLIAVTEAEIKAATTTDAVATANPLITRLADALDLDRRAIVPAWAIALTIAVEVIATGLPVILFHPLLGGSFTPDMPPAPTKGKVAEASASRGSQKQMATSQPTSWRKPPSPPRTPTRPSSGTRGRKRNPQVLDFVKGYTIRHGHPPSAREVQDEFPDIPKSTTYDYIKVAGAKVSGNASDVSKSA